MGKERREKREHKEGGVEGGEQRGRKERGLKESEERKAFGEGLVVLGKPSIP